VAIVRPQISVSLNEKDLDKLDALKKKVKRSRSNYVENLILKDIEEAEKSGKLKGDEA
jgi:metal-responsive CopG/Arc/MetJ family transcriptional regulator